MVAERDRLRSLEMRVTRHDRRGLGLCKREDDERERVDRLACFRASVQDVETERGRNLVVSRAAGMDLATDLTEEALDCRMHVLVESRYSSGV